VQDLRTRAREGVPDRGCIARRRARWFATLIRGGGGDMAGAKTAQRSMPIPPEAADLANEANSVFVDEDYDSALELYTQVRLRPVA